MATGGSVDLNCELTYSSVSGAALTPDAAYRTYEAKNTASCRNTLPGSSGTSPVESRGVYSQGMVIHGDSRSVQGCIKINIFVKSIRLGAKVFYWVLLVGVENIIHKSNQIVWTNFVRQFDAPYWKGAVTGRRSVTAGGFSHLAGVSQTLSIWVGNDTPALAILYSRLTNVE